MKDLPMIFVFQNYFTIQQLFDGAHYKMFFYNSMKVECFRCHELSFIMMIIDECMSISISIFI